MIYLNGIDDYWARTATLIPFPHELLLCNVRKYYTIIFLEYLRGATSEEFHLLLCGVRL